MKKPTMLPAVALHQHTLLTVTGRRPGGSTKQEINSDVWYAKHVPRATLGPPSFYSASALSRDFEGVVHASCMALCVGVLFPPGHWKVSRLLSGQSCYSTMGKCLHVVTLSYSKQTFPRKTLPSGPKWRCNHSNAVWAAESPPCISSWAFSSLVLREEIFLSLQLVK